METILSIIVLVFFIFLWIGIIFVAVVWPALLCYKQACKKNLFKEFNWIAIFIGVIFGWLGVIILVLIK